VSDPQKIRVRHAGDDEDSWVTVPEYLERYIATLIPMSVGQCVRFRMNSGVLDVEPRRTVREAILAVELHGQASVVVSPEEGVILILPSPVQVDVTFEGDEVIRAAAVG
jgi:hypothetical protein